MKYREVEDHRREIDDTRRHVDEKSQQLSTLASLGALIGGFELVVMVESDLPEEMTNTQLWFIVPWALSGILAVIFMFLCMISSAFMLVGIYKYDCYTCRDIPFQQVSFH